MDNSQQYYTCEYKQKGKKQLYMLKKCVVSVYAHRRNKAKFPS